MTNCQSMQQPEYKSLSRGDYSRVKDDILKLEERLFSPSEQWDSEKDFRRIFTNPETRAYSANLDGQLIGFVMGMPSRSVTEEFTDENGLMYNFDKIQDSFYVWTVEVDRPYQGNGISENGIGENLLRLMINDATKNNFMSLAGYFKGGAGLHLIEKVAGKNLTLRIPIDNYEGSEGYTLCKMDLDSE